MKNFKCLRCNSTLGSTDGIKFVDKNGICLTLQTIALELICDNCKQKRLWFSQKYKISCKKRENAVVFN